MARLTLLLLSALATASAFQGIGGWKPHLRVARSPLPQTCALQNPARGRGAYAAGLRALNAKAQGTVLVAAENKPHNGFMHVECPDRVSVMWDLFGSSGLLDQCDVLDVRPATEEELVRVHTREHVESVLSGSAPKDASTYFHKKESRSSDAARLAAGGTLQVAEAVCAGEAANGFCATRPPGHHAEPEHMMGFCIFNSVALAAKMAKEKYGKKRILIFDWDVHHGNGISMYTRTCARVYTHMRARSYL